MSMTEDYLETLELKDFYKFSHDVYTYMMLRVKLTQKQPDNILTQDPLIQKYIEPIVKAALVLSLVSRTDGPDAFLTEYVDFNDDDFMLFVMDITGDSFVDGVHDHALDILSTTFALIKKCSNKTKLDLFHVGATCFTKMLCRKEETFLAERGWDGLLIAAAPYEKAYDEFLGSFISKEIDWIKFKKIIHLKAKYQMERDDMIDVVEVLGEEPMDVEFFNTILPALEWYVEYHEKVDLDDKNLSAEKNPAYRRKLCEDCRKKKQREEMEFLTQELQNLTSEVKASGSHIPCVPMLNMQTD